MARRTWLISCLAALGVLLFMGSPASAAIERFVDSQGVVHIRSVNPGGVHPAPEASSPEEPVPAAPVKVNEPAPASPAGSGLPAQAENPAAAPPAPLDHSLAEQDVRTAAEANQRPETTAGADDGNHPALKKVSYPLLEQGAALFKEQRSCPPEALPAPAPQGTIYRFRDRRGTIHITNLAPESGTTLHLADADPGVGPHRGQPPVQEQTGSGPAWQRVAWTGGSGLLTPAAAHAAVTPAPTPGAIRRYRDAKGVLHIENFSTQGDESAPDPAPKLARPHQFPKEIEITGADGSPVLPWKKAALPLGPSPPPGVIKEVSPPRGDLLGAGTIRRYRDGAGILHIESVESPAPERLPAPVFLARPKSLPEAGTPSPLLAPPGSGQGASTREGPAVTAFRDQKGRLVIRNRDPDAILARSPGPEQNLALLAPILQEASRVYGLPVSLIRAVIKVESNFALGAVSPKGAMGLMQLMPDTAAFLGVQDAFDPRQNIYGGCRYLRLLLDYFGGSLPLALAAYNAGHGRVVACGFKVPPIKETQEFVTQVLGRYFTAEKRYRSPWV